MHHLASILILLSCSVVLIVVCRRIYLPPIAGYLLVGALIGPGGLRWLHSIEEMHLLAEFGVVFLMFTLGLEFSIPRLMATKRVLLGIGGLQVVITTIIATLIGMVAKIQFIPSLIIGGALSLSSTAVVIKQLAEQKEHHSSHGFFSINILLFQDLAAVLFLIVISALAGDSDTSLHITFITTVLKGIVVFIAMAVIGLWVLRPLFREVAKAHSTELFMIATLLISLSAASITYYMGLSLAYGAFLAGMILGETEFKHQIELDIRPFRDVLLGLFFVVIGSYLELHNIPQNWMIVLAILLTIVTSKTIITMIIVALFGKAPKETALRTGLILAHGGEFGFVILTEAINKDLLDPGKRSAIFAAIVLSVLIAPIMIRFNQKLCKLIFHNSDKNANIPTLQLSQQALEYKDHVIICGFGKTGQVITKFLDQEKIPWLALDLDPMRISNSSIAGENSFYGNATHPATLIAAGLSRARMVVVSFADDFSALEVVQRVREVRIDLPIFVRTRDDANLEEFQQAGATEVVPESLEVSIMLASHLLLSLGVPTKKLVNKVRKVHSDRYNLIRGIYKGHDDTTYIDTSVGNRRSLHSIKIGSESAVINKPLKDIIPHELEASIKSITREHEKITEYDEDMLVHEDDVIVFFATPEELVIIEEIILRRGN